MMVGIYLSLLLFGGAFTVAKAMNAGKLEETHTDETLGLYISDFDAMDNILQKLLHLDEKMAQLDVKLKGQDEFMQQLKELSLQNQKHIKQYVDGNEQKMESFRNSVVVSMQGMNQTLQNLNSKIDESMQLNRETMQKFRTDIQDAMKTSTAAAQKLWQDTTENVKQNHAEIVQKVSTLSAEFDVNFRNINRTKEHIKSKINESINTNKQIMTDLSKSVMQHDEHITQKIANLKSELVANCQNMTRAIVSLRSQLVASTKTHEESVKNLSRDTEEYAKQYIETVKGIMFDLKTELRFQLLGMSQCLQNGNDRVKQQVPSVKALVPVTLIYPRNCAEINVARDGVYQLNLPQEDGQILSFPAYCMLDPVDNCTRTVVKRTVKERDEELYQTIKAYTNGFGRPHVPQSSFFIGFEKLHVLTSDQSYTFYGIRRNKLVRKCDDYYIGNKKSNYAFQCTARMTDWRSQPQLRNYSALNQFPEMASFDFAFIKPKTCLLEVF